MDGNPDITIVICTYNRCETLKNALNCIYRLKHDTSFSYRFLVVDNNSTDKTREVVENFKNQVSPNIQYFHEPNQGISHARNKGIKEALGKYIVFTDDDCLPESSWLNEIYRCFETTDCDVIGGRVLPLFTDKVPAWVRHCKDLLRGPIVFHDYGEEIKPYTKPMIELIGANMAFKREAFEKFGYFRTDLGVGRGTMGDETEFFQRLFKQNCKIYYCGKAVVWHPVELNRLTLRYLGKWNIGLGKYRFMVDENNQVDKNLVCCFGVPRYFVLQMLRHTMLLPFYVFNRRAFIKEWKELTVKIGRVIAMRQAYLENKNVN